ncbi:hypothetical protein ACT3CE_10470 [Marinifilum sp. RC60d5]|uniref:hypothetical protein n=1 Tax=Marinifilum sp. RC60d5 TaxID=3458414 RepID=UPI0040375BBB
MDKKLMIQLLLNKTGEIQSLLEHFKNQPYDLEKDMPLLSDRIEGLSKEFELLKLSFTHPVKEIEKPEILIETVNVEIKPKEKPEITVENTPETIIPETVKLKTAEPEEASNLNDQLQKPSSEILGEKFFSNSLSDIQSAIGINDRFLFTRELFNNSTEEYNTEINFINSADNFSSIEDHFRKNKNWDFEDPIVNQFIEITKRKF